MVRAYRFCWLAAAGPLGLLAVLAAATTLSPVAGLALWGACIVCCLAARLDKRCPAAEPPALRPLVMPAVGGGLAGVVAGGSVAVLG